jgi:hypothetical protein
VVVAVDEEVFDAWRESVEAAAERRDVLRDDPVAAAAHRLRISRAATRRVNNEELEQEFKEPPSRFSLNDELAIEDPPLEWTVMGLHPRESNTVLSAAYKVGKTTMLATLLRSLVDGEPFLGEVPVFRPEGRVAYWNYEVGERQFRKWLRTLGIRNQDQAAIWQLRGHRLPLTVPFVEDIAVKWLEQREVSVLVVDPYSRAYGGEENDNTAVGQWLESLDVIKRRAGVTDLFMAAHFGRQQHREGAEHARGATRLDDWCDVRWVLTQDGGVRYFYANGRDVDFPEVSLDLDPSTLRLYVDGGSRREKRAESQLEDLVDAVVTLVRTQPGLSTTDLRAELKGGTSEVKGQAIAAARERGLVLGQMEGKTILHYPTKERP